MTEQNKKGPFDYSSATVLLTGGTSGIGLALAQALVVRGVPRLLVVARDETKLGEVAEMLADAPHQPRIETYAVDLTEPDAPDQVAAKAKTLGFNIDLLVNNAGVASAGPFGGDQKGSAPVDLVNLNVRALVRLTELFLPPMIAMDRGGVLNLGSTAGYTPVPYSAVYGATKAFVLSFSQALWAENQDNQVRIACVVPGVTRTNLGGENQGEVRGFLENVSVSEPEEVATVALAAFDDNDPARIVGTANKLLSLGIEALPEALSAKLIGSFKEPS